MGDFYYVYVLFSLKDNKFYIGFTNDIKRRMREHNQGKNPSTSYRLPLELIYYEAHLNKEDVRRRERYFKTTKGKTTLRQLLRESLKNHF
ncbi:MAG: GIY-YIG nuclease family protein [Candidatus Cloacimonadota bacterium]|nr:MAG: GIY-YIG nuclease family protein [Candidatus Cloacimonadota bacterium]